MSIQVLLFQPPLFKLNNQFICVIFKILKKKKQIQSVTRQTTQTGIHFSMQDSNEEGMRNNHLNEKSRNEKEDRLEEVGVPTLPCCSLAPRFWTGLVWVGFCVLTGAGRPRTAGLKSRRRESRRKCGRKAWWGEREGNKKRKLNVILKVWKPTVSDLSRNRERVLIVGEIRTVVARKAPLCQEMH